jgi:hypothetical protein
MECGLMMIVLGELERWKINISPSFPVDNRYYLLRHLIDRADFCEFFNFYVNDFGYFIFSYFLYNCLYYTD